MRFAAVLRNQKKVIKLFQNSLKKNRFVHTYLFEGAKGTSKREAAYYFAALMLCTGVSKPCLECENCHKVMKEIHPSVFYVAPDNGMIKKEQAEALEKEFSMTALTEGKRIYIIDEIDKANASAANSLLKLLEELSGDNYVIMTTENINNVLSTIKSRSQIVSFDRIPVEEVATELINKGIEAETAFVFARESNSASEVLMILQDEKVLPIYELAKKVAVAICNPALHPLLTLINEGDSLVKEPNKRYHQLFVDLLLSVANDKLYYITNQINKIAFRDLMQIISDQVCLKQDKIIKEVETILKFKQRLRYNVNLELFYAQLFIELKQI
ncbi:MAG TPA: AAA family ATPase [Bacilli bacterium]|nr:MAG: DNA polymerase III subunit tau [Tenericutes bacterium ADurb.BinA124]HNZ50141.1 AAA family ATPase [Bacilli bacterium]HOH17863.1 AAA family ATPase [Bacilli bacterium]HPN60596.1 AAA family ATPase [Bacilli bacterium]HPX84041.1 AAA family ATPase [Bacilli bacterium]